MPRTIDPETLYSAVAEDGVDGEVDVQTSLGAPGTLLYNVGEHTATFTASDSSGNAAKCR